MPIYTDIATEIYKKGSGDIPEGVYTQQLCFGNVDVTRVTISKEGLNRPKGNYTVLDMPNFAMVDDRNERYIMAVSNELSRLLPADGTLMVVGLGNEQVTADSLGVATAKKVFATRMIDDDADIRLRKVCTFTPGVAGKTGIDTAECINAIIRKVNPTAVICVDSLYTNDYKRLGCTVQITDTGLRPGGAYELNSLTIGCKTLAVGVPTMMKYSEGEGELIVTARQLDKVMEKAANVLALSINKAVQKLLTTVEISYLTS